MRIFNEKLQQSTNLKVAASLLDEKVINVRWLASDMVLLKQEMEKAWSEFICYMA